MMRDATVCYSRLYISLSTLMIRSDVFERQVASRTPGTVSSAHATVEGRSVPGERHKQ